MTSRTDLTAARWPVARAQAWDAAQPWLVGGNFTPSTASNQLEMWQAATFDPETIDRELGWAAAIGMTSMRVFLHDLCWTTDRDGFLERIDRFLAIAAKHRIGALFVFFDSCWYPLPVAGVQAEPIPHVHNSRWLQSPGLAIVREANAFAQLRGYVQGVMRRFRDDPRIHGWDLWNEPEQTSSNMPFASLDLGAEKARVIEPLLATTFAWAREVAPSQPLTSAVWTGDFTASALAPLARLQVEASDIISFHCYGDGTAMRASIDRLAVHGRPLWCSEYMARTSGSTFQGILPILAERRVAAWNWGLVAGRIQTQYSWDSWSKTYTAEPEVWFHDVFRRDGRPFDPAETGLIRSLTASANQGR